MEGFETTSGNELSTEGLTNKDEDTAIEYKIAAVLFKYYSPIQIIIALFGNIMNLLVFSRKTMRGSVTSFLFRVLAVADTYMILVTLIPEAMLELGGSSAAYATDPQCKIHGYIYFAGRTYAVWILLLIVLERFIGINFPHKAASLITFYRAKIACIILLIIIYLLYIPIIFELQATSILNEKGEVMNHYCSIDAGNIPYFSSTVFPWYDTILYSLLPFILMLVANSSIIYRLVKSNSMRTQTSGDSMDVSGTTAMLLGISFGFVICTLPYCINQFIIVMYGIESPGSYLLFALSALLVNMNHCINFYIYCLTGSRFRMEIRVMFGCAEENNKRSSFKRGASTSENA